MLWNLGTRIKGALPNRLKEDALPELPEVETVLRGLSPTLVGQTINTVTVRQPALRFPVPIELPTLLAGRTIIDLQRRGKYLIIFLDSGSVICHLGMSGSLQLVPNSTPASRHDHIDIIIGNTLLRYRDPRRFGLMLWTEEDPMTHPLLAALGLEPLAPQFTGHALHRLTAASKSPIKTLLMDSHKIVGVGNIYASESLFQARIHPTTPARDLTPARCCRLVEAVQSTLSAAIAAGGSSLRDFVHSDGKLGYFQQQYFVYGRAGAACRVCGTAIERLVMAQRATYFCPRCQRRRG